MRLETKLQDAIEWAVKKVNKVWTDQFFQDLDFILFLSKIEAHSKKTTKKQKEKKRRRNLVWNPEAGKK